MNQTFLEELVFPEERTLASFVTCGNESTVARLRLLVASGAEHRLVWLAGGSGTGKSHLAEALCRQANVWPDGYLCWRDACDVARESVFASSIFLVVDDLDRLIGDRASEQWIMHFIDTRRRFRLPTLLTASDGPAGVDCALRDLRTRLRAAEVIWLEALDDEVKRGVLREFARARGFGLSPEVANYMLTRHNRNLGRLIALVRQIDQHALAEKRAVTVPLVREILEQLDHAP